MVFGLALARSPLALYHGCEAPHAQSVDFGNPKHWLTAQ